ncbi:MAG: glycosyl hydrolase [Chloracidobacterium sp.]|nr:glycosyl hydrolase [Chloracidobacterium sp.]
MSLAISVYRRALITLTFLILILQPVYGQTPASTPAEDPLRLLQYRLIGPFRGGRVAAVAGVRSQPKVYYFGATGGGVWKTTDSGVNWQPVSDGYFQTGSVGAIDVSLSDPNIIYVGMGESPVRGNVSHGDGVYKSTDAGKTWKHVGLADSRQIGRVRIHPKNPDVVYVAAMGHLWGPNRERGVFRTTDGGKTWKNILFRSEKAGAFDLSFDPANPNVMYAAFWQVQRTPYSLISGGEGSSLYKTTDGGETWTDISKNRGLPAGVLGKIGVSVSPVNPNRVWAMVEAKEGGLYRSDDGGDTWQRTSDNASIRQRPWYYTRVYADTQNVDIVYITNVAFHKSIDGGRTFTNISVPHGDNHDLWIAPDDNQRMINSNDGGANVSNDGGRTWTEQDQATAQFYRVAVDNDFPYNIYGAQQDNSTVKIPSRTNEATITERDWYDVGGGESGWIAPHPENSDIVFAGSYGGLLTRYDHKTRQLRNVNVYPDNPMGAGAEAMKYRFQWNFPILFSPHRTEGKYALYAAGNLLFRSLDEGQSWQAISPDLTRNDKSKQGTSGGPITQDNTSVEYYSTIFALAESPLRQGVIWAGSDDGLVHVTQDGGRSWANVTPKDMPEWIQINSIEASPHDPATAYFAGTAYKSDDYKPYIFKTNDYGKTWRKVVSGIADDAFTRVVREDPNRKGFLYAGTETGMYYSSNDGTSWESLQLDLPVVPITDLAVHKRDMDLVVATQGRSFYALDNLTLLYQLADAKRAEAFLFKPEDGYRQAGGGGFNAPANATVGVNPPNGAVVHYWLKSKPKEVSLEFLDPAGKVVRKFTGRAPVEGRSAPQGGGQGEPQLPIEIGLNRFVWNYRLPNATTLPGLIMWAGNLNGPRVPPGNYQVRLSVDGKPVGTEAFAIKADPRLASSQEDLQKQFEFLVKATDKLSATHSAISEIRDLKRQLDEVGARMTAENKDLKDGAAEIVKKLTAVEEELIQTRIRSSQDALNYPIKLNNKLAALKSSVDLGDFAPTSQSYDVYNDLTSKIDAQLAAFARIKSVDIAAFNRSFTAKGLPVIVPRSR